ncbi:MAG: hypothetical protein QM504_04835 [Pseudomonadota bacterium]
MPMISEANIVSAVRTISAMDTKKKEILCDEIFVEQPNLLASVLVQQQMGNELQEIDVLLNVLMVLYIAIKESGHKISKITENEQEHQMKLFSATVKSTEGMKDIFIETSLNKFIEDHKESNLLSYVVGEMRSANFFKNRKESSKYLIMAGINLASCIATAKKMA